jgi:hypothetical protein
MVPSTSAELLTEWQRQAGEPFAEHFDRAWTYLGQTIDEVASEGAVWTVAPHAGHAVLVLAGDGAFAIVALSGPPDGVTISGALHPFQEGMVRVSFNDRREDEEVEIEGLQRFKPLVRQWSFDWHGRLQLPLEYWVPGSWPSAEPALIGATVRQHERERAMAHTLARAAGWPMTPEAARDQ